MITAMGTTTLGAAVMKMIHLTGRTSAHILHQTGACRVNRADGTDLAVFWTDR
jgi:hypothetical protein